MKRNLLITTAAVAILASTGLATAQDRGGADRGSKPAGAMEKSAPQMQMRGQQMHQQMQMRGEQRGQAQTPAAGGAGKMNERIGQSPSGRNQPADAAERPAQRNNAQRPDRDIKASDKASDKPMQKSDTERRSGQQKAGDDRQRDNQRAGTRNRTETTGRGDAANVQLTTEQRTRIRKVVVNKRIPKVTNVNFTVSIGARVPRTVKFYPIPVEIVQIHPAWRGYRVILVGSELVIVNPNTYEIVSVIVV